MGARRSRVLPAARRARRRQRLRRLDDGRAGSREGRSRKSLIAAVCVCILGITGAFAQDTTGTIEGAVTDKTAGAVAGARIVAINVDTGLTKEAAAAADGFYRLLFLPVGQYSVTVTAPQFATLVREAIQVNVSQTMRVGVQRPAWPR